MPTALASTRWEIRAVDLMAISAAIQAPSETPTTVSIAQIELIEQVEIEIGEVVDGVKDFGCFGAAEARMDRRDHARMRGAAGRAPAPRVEPDAGMQEQSGRPLPLLDAFDANAVDR